MYKLTCTTCGAEFEAKYGNRMYCSDKCKTKAWRARKKVEVEAAAPSRAAFLARVDAYDAAVGAGLRKVLKKAGPGCMELLIEYSGIVVNAATAKAAPVATNGTKKKAAEGAPMK